MIGVFAKMFGANERVTEFTEADGGAEVAAFGSGVEKRVVVEDGPPAAFVEKVSSEGGDLYVIPFMEAFRAWLAKRKDADAADASVEEKE